MGEREFAVVDTHCHIGLHKYEPVEVLLFHMARAGVDQAVLIQYMGNSDNRYIVEAMEANPGRLAAAMIVDDDDDGSAIRGWAEQGIAGIRLLADFRGRGGDPLAHWRVADELGLVVSVFSRPDILQSAEFNEVLRLFPRLSMVIEHLGGVKPGVDLDEFAAITALARHENLTIKLPGFGEFCDLPCPFENVPPLAELTLEAFGARRIMWGSDWPPVSSREGFDNSLTFPLRYLATLSADERAWIFGKTARQVWNLNS
ncbi:MAG: amidohydrolase family protein [Caldilineaceae bacterium]|nr:amidohydrolase family protein [Caldilineaceae bacterium]MDE0200515.1 amidohydrolase family protein [Caldilineaceae bacterium]